MNRHKLLSLLLLFLICGCSKDPDACFSIGENPSTSSFTSFASCSVDAESHDWQFGDGATSSLRNPTHKYSEPGIYTVTLTVKDGNKTDEITEPITVTAPNSQFIGGYQVSESCNGITDSYLLNITMGANNTSILLDNFANLFSGIRATINGNSFTITTQYGALDKFGNTWDIDSGSGYLAGNTLSLTFIIDDILYQNTFGWVNCSATANK